MALIRNDLASALASTMASSNSSLPYIQSAVRVRRLICRRMAGHGTLHAFLLRHSDDVTDGDVISRLLADVARAVDYIHSRRIVHGNVTSHAVYVTGPHTSVM